MLLLDLTLNNAFANVALDEALLDEAESGVRIEPVLRLWCPESPMVVMGRSSRYLQEVNVEFCSTHQIPIIRRCSGGATILSAPGCLMYAVVLSYDQYPQIRMLDIAHQFVMQQIQQAIQNCGIETQMQGTCDLTINDRKVSGNALRCKRDWLVYHGTLICQDMDLELISKCLGAPNRQPEYRQQRSHADFLTCLPISVDQLKESLIRQWSADKPMASWPEAQTNELVTEKYSRDQWNLKI